MGNPELVTTSYPHPPPSRPFKSASSTNEIINIPTSSKSMLAEEKDQRQWYKKMYESLHVEKKPSSSPGVRCTYPAGRIKTGKNKSSEN